MDKGCHFIRRVEEIEPPRHAAVTVAQKREVAPSFAFVFALLVSSVVV